MSTCGTNKNVNKTFIIKPAPKMSGVCETVETNLIQSCDEDGLVIDNNTEVRGNISAFDAINDNHLVTLSQVDDMIEARKDKNYVHDQGVPMDVWVINHNLNKKPSLTVIDSAGSSVEGSVDYLNDNALIVRFNGKFSGKATLN